MNDTVKLVLMIAVGAALIFAFGQLLGIDWIMSQASLTLAFVELVGKLLLLFTGSAAAIEVAKYFRRRNRVLDEAGGEDEMPVLGEDHTTDRIRLDDLLDPGEEEATKAAARRSKQKS